MPTLDEARRLILGHTQTVGTESVELIDSLNLVTAEDIVAPMDMPLSDNSAMDGFAVRIADCEPGSRLRVTGIITAGSTSIIPVAPGCAVKIMTGGGIPPGADAVIPFEEAEFQSEYVTFKKPPQRHQHIRFAGSDVHRDELVVPVGTVIRAPEISIMASCSRSRVTVFRRPRIAILCTGDELLEVGTPVVPGGVINSNGVTLAAIAKESGAIVELLGIARDTEASHIEKMTIGLQADIFITSAGVSVGERDFVRKVLADLGVSQVFSMIMFDELVKPAILKSLGYRRTLQPSIRALLQEDFSKRAGRVKLLRVRLESRDGRYLAFISGDQSTGMLKSSLRADGVAVLPTARNSFLAGEEVEVHMMSSNSLMRMEEEE